MRLEVGVGGRLIDVRIVVEIGVGAGMRVRIGVGGAVTGVELGVGLIGVRVVLGVDVRVGVIEVGLCCSRRDRGKSRSRGIGRRVGVGVFVGVGVGVVELGIVCP